MSGNTALIVNDFSPIGADDGRGALAAQEHSGLLQMTLDINKSVDLASMSARARICTPRVDRQGDIIEPSGVEWENYRHNPVVMFGHGFSGVPWPIAISEDKEGNLHVEYSLDENAIYARSFFSKSNALSYQLFGLIAEGFLRATSIHVMPMPGGFTKLQVGKHVHQSDLMEHSWCTVNVNPDSYRKALETEGPLSNVLHLQLEAASQILRRGTIGDTRLIPSLAKCLQAIAPPTISMERGNSVTEDAMSATLNKDQIARLTPVGLAKALAHPHRFDAITLKALQKRSSSLSGKNFQPIGSVAKALDDGGSAGDLPAGDLPEGTDPAITATDSAAGELPTAPVKAGAEFVRRLHASLASVIQQAELEMGAVEKAEVENGVKPIIDTLNTAIAELEGLFSSVYSDQPALSTSGDDAESLAKSWLANPSTRFQLVGLANRLESAAKGDGRNTKSVLNGTARHLRLLNSKAKSFVVPATTRHAAVAQGGETVPKSQYDALLQEHQQLREKAKLLVNKYSSAPAPLTKS